MIFFTTCRKKYAVSTAPDETCAFGTDDSDKVVNSNSNHNSVDDLEELSKSRSNIVSRSKQSFPTIHSIAFFTKALFFIFLGFLLSPATIDGKSVQSIRGKFPISGKMS